jgi:hypothetical protein
MKYENKVSTMIWMQKHFLQLFSMWYIVQITNKIIH